MKRIMQSFTQKNMSVAYLYFYIHLVTEVICFYTLSRAFGGALLSWLVPFIYDTLAFVPQSIIGYMNDKYPKINFAIIGFILLLSGFICFFYKLIPIIYISISLIALGNAFIHVRGAELTLKNSNGKLSHSAIFVSGGSFGLISGKLLAYYHFPVYLIILIGLSIVPFILLAEYFDNKENDCLNFNYHNNKLNSRLVILLAIFIVIVRGYMGYGIPTSWNKTLSQTVILYFMMGFGKAMGGILSDAIGMKKTAITSMLLSIPFLIFGNNIMLISLIGVFFFSMTMPITLGLLVSVLKRNPGLSFGLTTIGLFFGTVPIFIFRVINPFINIVSIIVFTFICIFISMKIIKGDEING